MVCGVVLSRTTEPGAEAQLRRRSPAGLAKHQTLRSAEHVAAAEALRTSRVGLLRPAPVPEVQTRALSDYDTALGAAEPVVDGGVG